MSNTKKNGITIANFIALIGMAGIGATTFFGELFTSEDGTPGVAIIMAVILVAALTFLLVFSIKAQTKDSDTNSWLYVEIASIIVYIVVAIIFSTPSQRFFYIVSEKENLKEMALNQVKAIDSMYMKYERQYTRFINDAAEQARNYFDSKTYNKELSYELKDAGISNKKEVDSWQDKALKVMKLQKRSEVAEIKSQIEIWNLLTLPSMAVNLEETSKGCWSDANKHIQAAAENNKLIPVIKGDIYGYAYDGFAKFDLGTRPESKFANALRAADGSTTAGLVIYIVLNFMVLFNYIVTNRSNKIRFKKAKLPGSEL